MTESTADHLLLLLERQTQALERVASSLERSVTESSNAVSSLSSIATALITLDSTLYDSQRLTTQEAQALQTVIDHSLIGDSAWDTDDKLIREAMNKLGIY